MANKVIEISKNQNETNTSVIRRFTRRVQDSGILRRARSLRFNKRKQSDYAKKKSALVKIAKRKVFKKLLKLGKVEEGYRGRGKRR